MSELVFAAVILIAGVIGLIGLGSMVVSPPLAQKIFLVAGMIGMLGFLGYAIVRVRAEKRERAQNSGNKS
jgi:hypothetical protein